MLGKFFNGLLFGTGFAIAFIAVVVIFSRFYLHPVFEESNARSSRRIDTPPAMQEEPHFLGSPAVYAGDFLDNRNGILTAGPGGISGKATLNDRPLAGLKLRLALNGSVMS